MSEDLKKLLLQEKTSAKQDSSNESVVFDNETFEAGGKYSSTEAGWLNWDLNMLKVFIRGISFDKKFEKNISKMPQKTPAVFADLKKKDNAVKPDIQTEYRNRIENIHRRINRENARLANLSHCERNEHYENAWCFKVKEVLDYIQNLNIDL